MDGEEESWTLAHKTFNKLRSKLDEFDNSMGFPAHIRDSRSCEYLELTRDSVKKMAPEECAEIAVDLSSYAIYVQRELSREISYLHWVESKINAAVAPYLNEVQGYMSFDQRKMVCILQDEYTKQLEDLRVTLQVKVDALSQLPFQINQLVKTLMEVQNNKRYSKG